MPVAYPKSKRGSGEEGEAMPRAMPERERLPMATVRLVRYAIDEVEWQTADDERRQR